LCLSEMRYMITTPTTLTVHKPDGTSHIEPAEEFHGFQRTDSQAAYKAATIAIESGVTVIIRDSESEDVFRIDASLTEESTTVDQFYEFDVLPMMRAPTPSGTVLMF